MTIVDTTVWVDYFRGEVTPQTQWIDLHTTSEPIGLTDLILCEILQGVREERTFSGLQRDLREFHLFTTGGADLAVAAAVSYRALCARGRTMRGTVDCLIATFCLLNGHRLLHDDRDYDAFEEILGLTVVHP